MCRLAALGGILIPCVLSASGCVTVRETFGMPDIQRARMEAPDEAEIASLERLSPFPHPFRVELKVEQSSTGGEDGGAMILSGENRAAIERYLLEALRSYRVFSEVVVADDSDSGGEAQDVDARLEVRIEERSGRDFVASRDRSVLLGSVSTLLWLVGGVPGWVVADTTFQPDWEITYSLERLPASGSEDQAVILLDRKVPGVDLSGMQLSFRERALGSDYAWQLLVPPVFVEPDRAKADYNLGLEALERAARDVARTAKLRLYNEQGAERYSLPFLHLERAGGYGYLLVLSTVPLQEAGGDAGGFKLELRNAEGRWLRPKNVYEDPGEETIREVLAGSDVISGLLETYRDEGGYFYAARVPAGFLEGGVRRVRGTFLFEQRPSDWQWAVSLGAPAGAEGGQPVEGALARR